jgi:hypothetical protein
MATKLTPILFFLFVQTGFAQKGNLYLTPGLGIQNGHTALLSNGFTHAILKNNRIYVGIYYSIGVDYAIKKDHFISFNYFNGKANVAVGVRNKPCNNGYMGQYGELSTFTGFNNKRLNLGYQFPIHYSKPSTKFRLITSLKLGLALDVKGTEEFGGGFNLASTNLCGELYTLKKRLVYRNPIALLLPIQINFEWYHKQKRRLGLAIFYHKGLTKNTQFDVDYVTAGYTDKSSFISRGTSYGAILNFPIKIYTPKKSNR